MIVLGFVVGFAAWNDTPAAPLDFGHKFGRYAGGCLYAGVPASAVAPRPHRGTGSAEPRHQ
jgi:hypothetical protein